MGFLGSLFVALQHVLPQRLLSRAVHSATRWRWRPWKDLLIRSVTRLYGIKLDEVERHVPDDFIHFNDFFTRELRPGARPLAPAPEAFLCPADGRVSQAGTIHGDRILQALPAGAAAPAPGQEPDGTLVAKGRSYSIESLLGGREDLAASYVGGTFATVYLAPHNYHRVHMPVAATLVETIYVPGRLFSVSPATVAGVDRLFARNERLVCCFRSPAVGDVALVLVGAMLVSSIETAWDGEVTRGSELSTRRFDPTLAPRFDRGDELGRFCMGSTVIVLAGPGRVRWDGLAPGQVVRMGERLGTISGAASGAASAAPPASSGSIS